MKFEAAVGIKQLPLCVGNVVLHMRCRDASSERKGWRDVITKEVRDVITELDGLIGSIAVM